MVVKGRKELKDVGWLTVEEGEGTWVRERYLHGSA